VAGDLSRDELNRLARLGAKARLDELQKEQAAIRAAFPDLFRGARGGRGGARTAKPQASRRRRRMNAAQRKAVSDRMRKYWADRRKGEAKAKPKAGRG
jgi:hypothetical protein